MSMELMTSDELPEVRKNAQSQLLALLRVKLTGKKPIRRNTRNERAAVIRGRSHQRRIFGDDIEGVDEVNIITARNSIQNRQVLFFPKPVPTNGRNFES